MGRTVAHSLAALTAARAKSTVKPERRETDVAFDLPAHSAQSHFRFAVRALAGGRRRPRRLSGERANTRRNAKRNAADQGFRRNRARPLAGQAREERGRGSGRRPPEPAARAAGLGEPSPGSSIMLEANHESDT